MPLCDYGLAETVLNEEPKLNWAVNQCVRWQNALEKYRYSPEVTFMPVLQSCWSLLDLSC